MAAIGPSEPTPSIQRVQRVQLHDAWRRPPEPSRPSRLSRPSRPSRSWQRNGGNGDNGQRWETEAIGVVMAGIVAQCPKCSKRRATSSSLFAALKKTELTETAPGPSRPLGPPQNSSMNSGTSSNTQGMTEDSEEMKRWKEWLHDKAEKAAEKARAARKHASVLATKLRKASKRVRGFKPGKLAQSAWWSVRDSWSRTRPRQRILSVALAFLLLMTLWPSHPVNQSSDLPSEQSIVRLSPDEEARLQMLSQTTPGVVYVTGKPAPWISETENQGEFVPGGSAWVFDSHHVVTSLKNIEQARRGSLKVILEDRTELPARVIGVDTGSDLAVLELPKTATAGQSLPVLPLGPSASLRLGQDVVLVGREATLDMRISKGVVYGLGQPLALVDADGHRDLPVQSCIQTDVLMNSDNRGGPLLNSRGQVVGMAVGADARAQVGQAIPSDSLQKHVLSIIASGHVTRPSLGMYLAPDGFAEKLWVTGGGVVVQEVIPGSAAKQAGLRTGDIIISQGDNPIHRMDDLMTVLEPFSPGDYFSLTVLRQTSGESIFAPFSSQTYSQVDLTVRSESELP